MDAVNDLWVESALARAVRGVDMIWRVIIAYVYSLQLLRVIVHVLNHSSWPNIVCPTLILHFSFHFFIYHCNCHSSLFCWFYLSNCKQPLFFVNQSKPPRFLIHPKSPFFQLLSYGWSNLIDHVWWTKSKLGVENIWNIWNISLFIVWTRSHWTLAGQCLPLSTH